MLNTMALVVLAVAGVVLALWFFTTRDDATTNGTPAAVVAPGRPLRPGEAARDAAELRRGNVLLVVARAQLPAARALALDTAGPASPSLRAAGQAVLVERAPGVVNAAVTAYAWRRAITTTSPDDPALRAFIDYWLGRTSRDG